MANAWGNGAATQNNEDMVSSTNNRNILKVNDVNNANDNKKAAHFINSSTHADARALKIEGKTEIIGNTISNGTITITGAENSLEASDGELWLGTSDVTDVVVIANAGKTTRVNGPLDLNDLARLNSHAVVVNGAAAVNTLGSGAGFIFNSAGHGGGASIDFYIAGVMVRYMDPTGWH